MLIIILLVDGASYVGLVWRSRIVCVRLFYLWVSGSPDRLEVGGYVRRVVCHTPCLFLGGDELRCRRIGDGRKGAGWEPGAWEHDGIGVGGKIRGGLGTKGYGGTREFWGRGDVGMEHGTRPFWGDVLSELPFRRRIGSHEDSFVFSSFPHSFMYLIR